MIKVLLNKLGYYKLSQLQPYGHCGCCGKSINAVFVKYNSWDLCDDCKKKD